MRKWLYLVLAGLFLAALVPLSGCAEEVTVGEMDEYVVGAIFSLTGDFADLGVPEDRTVKMMVEEINANGGINGKPLRVVVYNDESVAGNAPLLATRLIEQDKVLAIIGPSITGSSLAIIDALTTAKVPNISCAASIDIVEPVEDRYWIFKTPQTEVQAIHEIYRYLEQEGMTEIAIITDTSGFGAAGKKYLISEKDDYGISIVADQTFNTGDTTMQSQLTVISGTSPQAVICWATNRESAVVAQDMKFLGMTMPLFCSHGVANRAFITQAGEAADGIILPAGKLLVVDEIPDTDPQQEVLIKYRDDYEAIYGAGSANTFGGHAFDALSMVIMALEKLDDDMTLSEARQKIRDEIENISDFAGTGGVFTMSPTDHLGMAPGSLALIKIEDGEWTWLQ